MAELDPPPAASIAVARGSEGAPVVTLAGELDIGNVEELRAAMEGLGATTGPVVVDVTSLRFMDSSGIAVLLQAVQRGTALVLRRPSPIIRKLIEASGLTGVLPVEP
jgi:anti-anti-sigma factor